jgi:hypothetical protein
MVIGFRVVLFLFGIRINERVLVFQSSKKWTETTKNARHTAHEKNFYIAAMFSKTIYVRMNTD